MQVLQAALPALLLGSNHALALQVLLQPEALIKEGAWRHVGNVTQVASLRVWDPLTALEGCYGFDCVRRYCAFDDGGFSWGLSGPPVQGELRGVQWTEYKLSFISQTWIPQRGRAAAWVHGLAVFVPDSLDVDSREAGWATLFVNVDNSSAWQAAEMAVRTGSIAVALDNVPNQEQSFPQQARYYLDEETLKAFSWVQYAKNADHPEWPIEMPTVKAVVRAMDVVATFSDKMQGVPSVQRFVVTGASKRGITTFMAGAVDPRVAAIIPITISLDLHTIGEEAVENLGGIMRSLKPYLDEGTYDLTAEQEERVHAIIDPINYKEHLTMPKLLMNTGADRFFQPDVTRSWWSSLPKPKGLYLAGNCGHESYGPHNDFLDTADAFVNGLLLGEPTPEINWDINESTGVIAVRQASNHTPIRVQVWSTQTANSEQRDFRDAKWTAKELSAVQPSGGGSWLASSAPKDGRWVAFYVSFEYNGPRPGGPSWKLSTEVSVVPNARPFSTADTSDPQFRHLVLLSKGRPLVRTLSS